MVAELVNYNATEPERKPFKAEERAKRRRAEHIGKRYAEAQTPRQRYDVAIGYFTATIADGRVDQAVVAVALERLARILIDQTEQLTQTLRRYR